MHVVHLLRKLDASEWGGTETAIQRLCHGLRSQGVESAIYCPRLDSGLASDPISRMGIRVERFNAFVPVLGISRARRRQLVAVGGNLMSFDLVHRLWREDRMEIMHCHTLGRMGGIALTMARQRRVPFVVSIHGGVLDLPLTLQRQFNDTRGDGWEWGRLFGLLFQSHRLFVDADAIITCNENEARLLRERHPEKRVLVQPHAVPLADYERDGRQAFANAFPALAGKRLIVCLGRIDPVKNQSWLVEQAPRFLAQHPERVLVLAGPCTDEPYGESLYRRIVELGLGHRIILTGGFAPDDLRLVGLLQSAAVVVLPSVSETFGLVILEAWACGAPVLASRTSGASALVREGENGRLFDLDQPGAFHAALETTLADPATAGAQATKGRDLVRKQYSVEAVAGRVRDLYSSLKEVPCAT
jgi:glycosyltransferase involved in cell wall biosynthesis